MGSVSGLKFGSTKPFGRVRSERHRSGFRLVQYSIWSKSSTLMKAHCLSTLKQRTPLWSSNEQRPWREQEIVKFTTVHTKPNLAVRLSVFEKLPKLEDTFPTAHLKGFFFTRQVKFKLSQRPSLFEIIIQRKANSKSTLYLYIAVELTKLQSRYNTYYKYMKQSVMAIETSETPNQNVEGNRSVLFCTGLLQERNPLV